MKLFPRFSQFKQFKRQAGMTLIEMITSLAILALVIGGALALYNSASTSQSSTQFGSDITSLRSAIRTTYYGQGGYGIAAGTNLNAVLIAGKRIPSTMSINGVVVTHSLSGTVTATGYVSTFGIAFTNIPTAVCMNLLTGASGWNAVAVTGGTGAIAAFPIPPATAASECALGTTVTFTGA